MILKIFCKRLSREMGSTMKKHQEILLIIIAGLITASCSHMIEDPEDPEVTRMAATTRYVAKKENKYESLIARRTVNDALYKGLTNIFQYHATILSRDVLENQIEKQTIFNKWDAARATAEREKAMQTASTTLRVFLAFYAPDRPNNKVLGKDGSWSSYVIVGSDKFQGKIIKSPYNLPETRRLYPYMDPWVRGYIVEFPIPTSVLDQQGVAKFILTGPAGTSEKIFNLNGETHSY